MEKATQDFHSVYPEKGSFIGWKKGRLWGQEAIIKLLIPEDAKRIGSTPKNCRASKAKVLEIRFMETGEIIDIAYSYHIWGFEYHSGEYVYCDDFGEDSPYYGHEPGIYFFMTEQEAINYYGR